MKKTAKDYFHALRMLIFLAWWVAVVSAGVIVLYLMLRA